MVQGIRNPLWLSREPVGPDSAAHSDDQSFQGGHPPRCETLRLRTKCFSELLGIRFPDDPKKSLSHVKNSTMCAYCL